MFVSNSYNLTSVNLDFNVYLGRYSFFYVITLNSTCSMDMCRRLISVDIRSTHTNLQTDKCLNLSPNSFIFHENKKTKVEWVGISSSYYSIGKDLKLDPVLFAILYCVCTNYLFEKIMKLNIKI